MLFWKYLSGILTVEFTSADPERTLNEITDKRIQIFRVLRKKDLTCQIRICRGDLPRLSKLLQRQGSTMTVTGKQGLYWPLRTFLHRPVLLGVFLCLLFLSCYLPTRIFFVTVEGNAAIPDRQILAAAEDCGIRFGASRKLVRSEKVKNALLCAVPALQWAGVNTSGCTAVISVREGVREALPSRSDPVSSLVADRDGYILSVTVTAGTPRVFPGEAVVKGQVLVSGYTDCGIRIRGTSAAGEILAQTSRDLTAVMPERFLAADPTRECRYRISLLLGKKRINLWKDSRISDTGCGRMYEEYYFSLPGGFRLPAAICVDRYIPYETRWVRLSEEEGERRLLEFSDRYLIRHMVAGQILEKQQRMTCRDGCYRLESRYTCTELMGKAQREQIGVINGKGN